MGCQSARSEAGHCESLHFALFGLVFSLQRLQLSDLSLGHWASLQTRTAVHVDLEAALDMPLYFLTLPAVLKPLTHLERNDLVAELHKVVEYTDVCGLELAIEEVTLDNVRRVLPLLLLPQKLALLDLGCHGVLNATWTLHSGRDRHSFTIFFSELVPIETVRLLEIRVVAVQRRCSDQCAFLERVGN